MRIHRAFCAHIEAAAVTLDGDEAHHLIRALRVRPGDAVELFDGEGSALRYQVEAVERRQVQLTWVGDAAPDPTLPSPLRVAVAPPKGKRAQRLVEGLTELGVAEIRFLLSSRTQAKLPDPEQTRRWVLEACKQCGRHRAPRTGPPLDLAALQEVAAGSLLLVGDPRQGRPLATSVGATGETWVAVGPEGGLSADELEALREAGAVAVRLGPAVLRVETAALGLVAGVVAQWEAEGEADSE